MTGSRRWARPDALGNAVHEEVGDVECAQIPGNEVLVVCPQPLADLRHRRSGQQQPSRLVLESIFDIAHRKPPRQHLDRQVLKTLGVALQMIPQLGAERPGRAGNLRRRIAYQALRRLHASLANPIAMAPTRIAPVFVIVPTQGVANLRLQPFLNDQARGQPHKIAPRVLNPQAAINQPIQGFTRPRRSW